VHELQPGQALIVKRNGRFILDQIDRKKRKNYTFVLSNVSIFSRGSDYDIYRERKKLGELLIPKILKTIDYDFDHTVFSFIPNTAEVAYFGMLEALEKYCNEQKARN